MIPKKIKIVLGNGIIATFFMGLFVFAAQEISFEIALKIFGFAFVGTAVIVVGVALAESD